MKDLALLVADKNMDFTMRGVLGRREALGIRKVEFEILTHVHHDGGVRTTGPETLALLQPQFRHGILMLDREGSGAAVGAAMELQEELDSRLARTWGEKARSIVIEPELDAWVWGSNNALGQIVGWSRPQSIRDWLRDREYRFDANEKPSRPKEALECLVRELRRPRSSALYETIAGRVSFSRCSDPAFCRLRDALRSWFPAP